MIKNEKIPNDWHLMRSQEKIRVNNLNYEYNKLLEQVHNRLRLLDPRHLASFEDKLNILLNHVWRNKLMQIRHTSSDLSMSEFWASHDLKEYRLFGHNIFFCQNLDENEIKIVAEL